MASSSSSLPTQRWTYDVFLSFRGEDTRMNFVDHLYAALVQKGIHTFKDDEMLQRGKLISSELLKAIEESRFAVVVFSENYANSSWCLDELSKIMECREIRWDNGCYRCSTMHVEPSDVRGMKRSFAAAFQHYEEEFKGDVNKLNKWKEALAAASTLSGWHVSKAGSVGESKFINNIVQEILAGIRPHGMETNLIGIESRMDALNSLLCTEATEEVRVIGIWGMGGIGKTTIAQALFRRIAYKFESSSFVKDVREYFSSEKDIWALQEKIQRDGLVIDPETLHPKFWTSESYRAISYTGHLPLALKVLGSFLHGRQASVWESALNRLAKEPNIEIFETLKLSFNGLDDSEKNIFLDIACFFKGKDKEHVIRILDSFGFDSVIGISVLIEKSLITSSNEKLGMHDLIQEMGWQIVRQSFSNSRW
ncbi:hypothetical protein OSB04_029130 [Centaurea solstitialis]|uniref:TIR domain-containing protein n=1 Tax=Centaurea solstitialis TaxID=347529 RepID=A0AA38SH01_9ASTR|nr:hypothetical protein OSB04_029130 [Centaurea solstitialis]